MNTRAHTHTPARMQTTPTITMRHQVLHGPRSDPAERLRLQSRHLECRLHRLVRRKVRRRPPARVSLRCGAERHRVARMCTCGVDSARDCHGLPALEGPQLSVRRSTALPCVRGGGCWSVPCGRFGLAAGKGAAGTCDPPTMSRGVAHLHSFLRSCNTKDMPNVRSEISRELRLFLTICFRRSRRAPGRGAEAQMPTVVCSPAALCTSA